MLYFLLVAHVLLTTTGYIGLIATTINLLFIGSINDVKTMHVGFATWQKSARIFGPLLAIGVLTGFGLAVMLHIPLGSTWLVVTYILIAVALGMQAGVMVPLQLRATRVAAAALPSLRPARLVLGTLIVVYTAIIGLMLVRP